MNDFDMLLTTRQLQELIQVDRVTIYRMLKDGCLQGFKVGGQWRFSRRAIERWLQEQQARLAVAEDPPGVLDARQPTAQSLPLSCIQAIQDIFAEALGIGAVTTTMDGTPLTSVANSCEFCALVRGTKAGRERCIASWQATAGQVQATPRLVTCHAGLRYVWDRIELSGEFVAAIHAGQFLDSPPASSGLSSSITELAAAAGLQAPDLQGALNQVPVLDERQLEQLPRMLHRVAQTFSEIGEERMALVGRLQRIAEMTTYP
jgi:excisionase family DNA binding protein